MGTVKDGEVEIHMISLLSGNELMLGYERDNVGLKKVGSEMGATSDRLKILPLLFPCSTNVSGCELTDSAASGDVIALVSIDADER